MMQSLEVVCHKLTVDSKQSQAQQRKQKLKPPPVTREQIRQIAKAVGSGEINLPDLTFDSGEGWVALWAIMD